MKTKKCKSKQHERGCTCHLNKGANVFEAACDLVNEFLIFVKGITLDGNQITIKQFIEKHHSELFFIEFAHEHYNTKDGKDDDIKTIAKLADYVVQAHIQRNDIETIGHVKPKFYPSGEFGWTSFH